MRTFALIVAGMVLMSGCSVAERPSPSSSSSGAGQPREILCAAEEAHLIASGSFQSFDSDVVVGPLSWPQLKLWATADPSGYRMGGSENDFKLGAQLKAGSTVTVSVAPEARAYAGLDYGQASGYSPALAVTFHACANSATAYVGGFHVEGRRCVPVDVSVDGMPPVRIVISFFNGQRGP
jgi:hypothetical protein